MAVRNLNRQIALSDFLLEAARATPTRALVQFVKPLKWRRFFIYSYHNYHLRLVATSGKSGLDPSESFGRTQDERRGV